MSPSLLNMFITVEVLLRFWGRMWLASLSDPTVVLHSDTVSAYSTHKRTKSYIALNLRVSHRRLFVSEYILFDLNLLHRHQIKTNRVWKQHFNRTDRIDLRDPVLVLWHHHMICFSWGRSHVLQWRLSECVYVSSVVIKVCFYDRFKLFDDEWFFIHF